jgi:hypothetical protein
MMRKMIVGLALASSLAAGPALAQAQVPGVTALRIQVVLARYDGDKKVSSMPNELWVNLSDDPKAANEASLRVGVQVPVNVQANNTTTVAFKDVGNRIDCNVIPQPDGRYRVSVRVGQSSVDSALKSTGEPGKPGNPMLRDFSYEFTLVLRDGQTVQAGTATDPLTGETLKVSLTLNVVR